MSDDVPVVKGAQTPVPTAWRAALTAVVDAIAANDFEAVGRVPTVTPLTTRDIAQIRSQLSFYGGPLVPLPSETWKTSVAQWAGNSWTVLVDLFNASGRTDVVLEANVFESAGAYRIEIELVYVP